jgi:PAS domain S-box-containing protein
VEGQSGPIGGFTRAARALDLANVIVHRGDGTILDWTRGCERLYGWTRQEALGTKVDDLLAIKFPEPRHTIRASLYQTGSWQGELEQTGKDGSKIWTASLWQAQPADEETGFAILQTNTDITGLKRTQSELAAREAHLRSILATVPEAMVVIDEKGLITSFSAAAEQLFGYSAQEACGQNVSLLMPEAERTAHGHAIEHYLKTGEAHILGYGRVVTGQAKDGTKIPIELAVGEARVGGQHIFTGFMRDLTNRQKMEQELRQSQKMEAIGQLTGGIAHDFNNLLTVITGNLEMLEARLRNRTELELVREAQDAAMDGAKLTAQLLAFGRRQPLNPKLVDIGEVVSEFSTLLRRTLGEAIELQTSVTGTRLRAIIDVSQLQNALLNLVINARDAMPRGGRVMIDVAHTVLDADYAQTYPEARSGRHIVITVSDTGAGMSEEVRRRAFEPFFTTKPVGAGTGLGLSMVHGFVKQSGGDIQLYSEAGRGTSARIFLPLPETAGPQDQPRDAARDLPRGDETVLVVEDDARVRRVAVARLRSFGYRIVEAEDAPAALAILAQTPEVALLFTDVVMPGEMTGVELARVVLAQHPQIKILFSSGYAEPALALRGLGTGAWLKKPYPAADLARKVREILDQPRA